MGRGQPGSPARLSSPTQRGVPDRPLCRRDMAPAGPPGLWLSCLPTFSCARLPGAAIRRKPFVLLEENLLTPAELNSRLGAKHAPACICAQRGARQAGGSSAEGPSPPLRGWLGRQRCLLGTGQAHAGASSPSRPRPPTRDQQHGATRPGSAAGPSSPPVFCRHGDVAANGWGWQHPACNCCWRSTPGHGSEHSGKVLQRKQGAATRRKAQGAAGKQLKHEPGSAPLL